MGLLDLAKEMLSDPDVRGLIGRVAASGARDCGAPGCGGKSLPGMVCCICQTPLCNTHATARVMAPTQPMCSPCIDDVWNADNPNDPKAPPPAPPQPKKRTRK